MPDEVPKKSPGPSDGECPGRSPAEATRDQQGATASPGKVSPEIMKVSPEIMNVSPGTTARGPLPLRMRDQLLLAIAATAALGAMFAYCVRTSRWGTDPIEIERQPGHELDYRIELNAATWVEWSQLRGIGPVLAHRIVEERERNGPFRDIDDLDRVKGIGPKKIDAIRAYVWVEARGGLEVPDVAPPELAGPRKSR